MIPMADRVSFDIPLSTIIKVVLTLVGLWLLWALRDLAILVFVVLVLVAAVSPVIDRWSERMPRVLAILLMYLLILFVLGITAALLIPPLIIQIGQLANALPDFFARLLPDIQNLRDLTSISQESLQSLSVELGKIGNTLYTTTRGVVGGIFALFTIFILSFYLLIEEKGAKKLFLTYFPAPNRERIAASIEKIGKKLGGWLRGQLLLMLLVGVAYLVALSILNVPYALALAVWGGLVEIIPYVGPILFAIPAVLIAFTVSPLTGFLVLILFIIFQQIENQLIVPKVMQRTVGLSPVVIIISLLAGGQLFGILGIILAIPIAAVVSVILQEWSVRKSN
jgi:predicted PurR-regulated permease PerM